jgi:hypothetical protein
LQGYDIPAAANTVVHSGAVYSSGSDNAENGDLYVAVSTRPSSQSGRIEIRRSTDHGQTWSSWDTYDHGYGIVDIDLVVSEWGTGDVVSNEVLVLVADTASQILCVRFPMSGGTPVGYQVQAAASGWTRDDVQIVRDTGSANYPVYVTWESLNSGTGASSTSFARSLNNGTIWQDYEYESESAQSQIAAGPGTIVHRVIRRLPNADDAIEVKRSTDSGQTWSSSWIDLTAGDDALFHWNPTIGTSTDGAYPVVWVGYDTFGDEEDVHFAYSTNNGATWLTANQAQVLAGRIGVHETRASIEGYRDGVSQWVNTSFLQEAAGGWQVVWRYSARTRRSCHRLAMTTCRRRGRASRESKE